MPRCTSAPITATCKASGSPGAKPHELVDALNVNVQRFCCLAAGAPELVAEQHRAAADLGREVSIPVRARQFLARQHLAGLHRGIAALRQREGRCDESNSNAEFDDQ